MTQEATDKDGNELRKNLAQRVAVVIRKPLTLQRLTRPQGLPEPLTEPSYGAGQHRYGWRQRLYGTSRVVTHAVFKRSFLRHNA